MNSRAIASRSGRAPQVTAYWLTSSAMARHAASLSACGAGKSGNPCDRFTPPYNWFRRVISRMTDSVNCVAFFDPVSLLMSAAIDGYAALRVFFADALFLDGVAFFVVLFDVAALAFFAAGGWFVVETAGCGSSPSGAAAVVDPAKRRLNRG